MICMERYNSKNDVNYEIEESTAIGKSLDLVYLIGCMFFILKIYENSLIIQL